MEDILASIKKVIADEKDQRGAPRGRGPDWGSGRDSVDPEQRDEILELDEPPAPPSTLVRR